MSSSLDPDSIRPQTQWHLPSFFSPYRAGRALFSLTVNCQPSTCSNYGYSYLSASTGRLRATRQLCALTVASAMMRATRDAIGKSHQPSSTR